MRKILTILGAIFIFLIFVGAIAFSGLYYYASRLDKEAKAFIDEVIPIIVASWNSKELIHHASPEFRQSIPDDEIELLFSIFSERMGPLEEYKGSTGNIKVTMTLKGPVIMAIYLAKAMFKNGPGKIEVQTIRRKKKWQIVGFRVILDIDELHTGTGSKRI